MDPIKHSAIRFTMTLLFVLAAGCLSADAQTCFDYGPPGPAVSLTGTLRSRVFAGPPNYESIKKGDRKETALILTLAKPACTNGTADEAAENDVREVQLVVRRNADWKTISRLMSKRAVVTGTLFHGHTGHHRTSVLIDVSSIRDVRKGGTQ